MMIMADAASATGSNHRGSAREPTPTLTMIQIMTPADTRARPANVRFAHGFQPSRWPPVATNPSRQPTNGTVSTGVEGVVHPSSDCTSSRPAACRTIHSRSPMDNPKPRRAMA